MDYFLSTADVDILMGSLCKHRPGLREYPLQSESPATACSQLDSPITQACLLSWPGTQGGRIEKPLHGKPISAEPEDLP